MSWDMVKLSDICITTQGVQITKANTSEINYEGGYRYLYIADFISEKKLSFVDDKYNQKKVTKDDLVMANTGSPGRVFKGKSGILSNNLFKISFDKTIVNRNYLYLVLSSKMFQKVLQCQMKGGIQKHLGHKTIGRQQIPLPPLPEQKRIAAILDKADAIRRKRQQAIDLADEFLRSVFLDMFGDPVTNPKGWDTPELGESIYHANNGLSRRRKTQENEGSLVLRLQDIHYDGIRFEKDLNRIKLDEKEKSRYELEYGDILFIRVNGNPDYVGRSAVFANYSEPVYHNDHIIRLKLNNNYNPFFLSYLFNQKGGRKLISKRVKTSAGQHTINQEGIKVLPIILPPISLQDKFEKIIKKKQGVKFDSNSGCKLFNALSQQAFAGKL